MSSLDLIAGQVQQELAEKDKAREKALPLCRDSIRHSSNAIRAVHRQEFNQAAELLQSARNILSEAEEAVADYSELISGGFIRDAQKELAEGNITLALVIDKQIPLPVELGVDAAAYLNGMGEAVGELRRYLLDSMRRGDLSRGEELLSIMDDIYGVLVTIDFPDAITGGLRRTTDMVRGVLERTRSDLTLVMRQKEVEIKLEDFHEEEILGLPQDEPALSGDEQDIYGALCKWRDRKASEENLGPFIIARNSWLREIVKSKPTQVRDLVGIKGFGERRANKYGKEIIEILRKGQEKAA